MFASHGILKHCSRQFISIAKEREGCGGVLVAARRDSGRLPGNLGWIGMEASSAARCSISLESHRTSCTASRLFNEGIDVAPRHIAGTGLARDSPRLSSPAI